MNDDSQALHAVLDSGADQDVPADARRAAERDVAAIRRGLSLLAADAPVAARSRRDRTWRWLAGAAAAAVVVGIVAVATIPGRDPAGGDDGTSIGAPAMPLTLSERVAAASRIVVGTVTSVDRGRIDGQVEGESGDPYVLATVRVDEAIKGPGGELVAFSYDLGATVTSVGGSRAWSVGDRVLLFLVPDVGTVSADVGPPHLQVAEGEAGRYFVRGDALVDADFTLEDVRREAQ